MSFELSLIKSYIHNHFTDNINNEQNVAYYMFKK